MTGSRTDLDVELNAPGRDSPQTIGVFAHAVGLSPSALRQYGETGLLVPIDVDERTGYRYYAPAQQQRAIWIRRLRDAGLGLSKVRALLDGDADRAESVLDDWLRDAQARQLAVAELISDAKASLRARAGGNPVRRTTVRFDGAVIAAAMDQARAANDAGSARTLLEVHPDAVSVVGMSRRLLIARSSVAGAVEGPAVRVCFDADSASRWLRARRRADLVVDAPTGRDGITRMTARFQDDARETFSVACEADLFPDIRGMIGDGTGAVTRAVFPRDEVLRATEADRGGVILSTHGDCAVLEGGGHVVSGSSRGGAFAMELSGTLLRRVAEAAAGASLTCDIAGPTRALVWRAPSQPDLVALMMPRAA